MLRIIVLTAALALSTMASAQTIDPIKRRADEIQHYRDLLASPDPNVRLATLEAVLRGKDPSLRALAISAALSTGDPAVQSAALLNIFAGIHTIIIEPTTKGLILTLMVSKFDPVTGSFEAMGFFRPKDGVGSSSCGTNLPSIRGQLTGLVVQFADPGCTGSLTFHDKRFVGTINLGGQPSYEGAFVVQ